MGEAPTGIKRASVAADFFATQQGFKACQRVHDMHLVDLGQQLTKSDIAHDFVKPLVGFLVGKAAQLHVSKNRWVGFVNDIGIGIGLTHRLEQA